MSRTRRRAAVLALAALPVVASPAHGLGPRHETLVVRYSRFSRHLVHVHAGDTVRFVVANLDPIDHELIVGDAAVQAFHERSSDGLHHGDGGAVSVPARTVATLRYRFDRPGRLMFACHLPGHFAYGMHGVIVVDD